MPTIRKQRNPQRQRMTVRWRTIVSLKPNPQNSRIHPPEQLEQIAASIRAFGFRAPVLIDSNSMIVVGHGRTEAARMAGLTKVPAIVCDDMTPDEVRAYTIADNKLAEGATWDEAKLATELKALLAGNVDIRLTGFTLPDLDVLLREPEPPEPDKGKLSMDVHVICPKCQHKFVHK
jgi:ParB-like chromosome segregation protein Spo0J